MLCGGVRLSPTNQKENYILKKKDEILFIVPPRANQSATAGTGIVTGVDGDLATCSVFLSPVEARTVTVYATSGQAVEQTLNVDRKFRASPCL